MEQMEQFEIPVNKFMYNIYKRISEYFLKKAKKNESCVINPISVKFPSAHCIIVKFNIVNKNEKYEIVKQGDWKEWYAYVSNNPEKLPEDLNIEMVIKYNMGKAYKIA